MDTSEIEDIPSVKNGYVRRGSWYFVITNQNGISSVKIVGIKSSVKKRKMVRS